MPKTQFRFSSGGGRRINSSTATPSPLPLPSLASKNLETRSTYTRTRVRRCCRAVERTRTLACRQTDTDRSAGECPSETGLIGPNRAHEQQHHKHTQKKTCCSNRNKHTHVYGNNDYSITIVNTETHTHTHTFAVSVRARVTFLVGWLAGWGPVSCMSCLSC